MSCREDLIKIAQEVLIELGKKQTFDAKFLFLRLYQNISFRYFDEIDLKDISKEKRKYELTKDIMKALCFTLLMRRQIQDDKTPIKLEELCEAYTDEENKYLRSKLSPQFVDAKVMDGNGSSNAAGGGQAIAVGGLPMAIAVGGIPIQDAEEYDPDIDYNVVDAGTAERKKGGKKTKHRRNKKTKRRRNRKTKLRRQTRK